MGLWLEHRTNGVLDYREKFVSGIVWHGIRNECDGTIESARKLARQSNDQPLEKREWVLRIGFGE